ncbi:MAG: alpha/beta hydrolase [Kofleriaceae bacterium]
MQVLFVQGAGAGAHDEWDQKLVADLGHHLGRDYVVRFPRMPDEANPRYGAWNAAIERELDADILVGHSIGGTILAHTLAERARSYRALILIAAPFIGEGGWPSDEIGARSHFELPSPVWLFHGAADKTAPVAHAHLYAKAIPNASLTVLEGRDHQMNNDLREVAAVIRANVVE